MKFSRELAAVFDKAAEIYYDSEEISCMNLLLAMAVTGGSLSGELLGRLGLKQNLAESFFITVPQRNTLSQDAEKAIFEAQRLSDYGFVCSHHLLRAIIALNYPQTRQLLIDFGITAERVFPIIEAMCRRGVGKEETGVRVARGGNRRLETQLNKIIKQLGHHKA